MNEKIIKQWQKLFRKGLKLHDTTGGRPASFTAASIASLKRKVTALEDEREEKNDTKKVKNIVNQEYQDLLQESGRVLQGDLVVVTKRLERGSTVKVQNYVPISDIQRLLRFEKIWLKSKTVLAKNSLMPD